MKRFLLDFQLVRLLPGVAPHMDVGQKGKMDSARVGRKRTWKWSDLLCSLIGSSSLAREPGFANGLNASVRKKECEQDQKGS